MVCTAKDLLEWKDFPKGLRVLLLDQDVSYASEIRLKLEGMDYTVSMFCNEDEALSAALSRPDAFHVAIIEVSTVECDGSFKFLQMAKVLPTIMTTSVQSLNTSMKCIALGAIQVLNKPLSEDKLRNIWQHVVHKAYNAGGNVAAESTTSVKELIIPMVKDMEPHDELMEELPCLSDSHCDNEELDRSSGNDKCPAPSTPLLKQVRSLDDSSCQHGTKWFIEKDIAEHYVESKSVETTCFNTTGCKPVEVDNLMQDCAVKEENDSADGCKSESDTSPQHKNQPEIEISSLGESTQIQNTQSDSRNTGSDKINRKKMKVDWTPDLHKKFVQAVEQLGIDQAIPSRILELMKVEGLMRHNVASHLQKYRMHRRHTLPKREERKLSVRPKDTMQSSYYYQHKPIMAYPRPVQQPYFSNQTLAANQVPYPMWVHPGSHTSAMPAWGLPYQTWPWKSYTAIQAEAWGCPVMPAPQGLYSYYPQQKFSAFYGGVDDSPRNIPPNIHNDHHIAEEVIDKTVKEAISKPWLPLPLGLKPPSTESVLSELSKQSISNIPPPSYQK